MKVNVCFPLQSKNDCKASRKLPILQWLPKCTLNTICRDFFAGITVALTEIPQSIAYAGIAGLPLQYGLYSSFMGGFMYAIFGSCKIVNMGVTSIITLMLQPHVHNLGPSISALLSFLTGLIIFTCGLLQFGCIIDYFSYPIVTGFTSAAALTIISSQLKNFFGIPGQSNGFASNLYSVINNSQKIRQWDTILGVTILILLCLLKEMRFVNKRIRTKWLKRIIFTVSISRNAIIVVICTILAYWLAQSNLEPFRLVGHIDSALPTFEVPQFETVHNGTSYTFTDLINELNTALIFVPLIAILETVAVAKVFSPGRVVDASQEMIALGIATFAGSFFRSMPVSSAFSRTTINVASGAQTNLSGVFTGLFILLTSNWLNIFLNYVPKSVLAAVIISAMLYIIEYKAVLVLWRTRKIELIPFTATLLSCLLLSIDYGILIGIGVNLIFVIYESSRPKITVQNHDSIYLITINSTLQFPSAQYLYKLILETIEDQDVRKIQINGATIDKMDVTVVKSFNDLITHLTTRQIDVEFVDFKPQIRQVFVDFNAELSKNFVKNP